jgi:hypothetical protein
MKPAESGLVDRNGREEGGGPHPSPPKPSRDATPPAKPAGSTRDLIKDIVDIEGRVDRHPYGMLAGALGAGFILGGGLFTRLTERIAGTALRIGVMAALPRLEEEFGRRMGRSADAAGTSGEKGEP